jgi:hypothetical protein
MHFLKLFSDFGPLFFITSLENFNLMNKLKKDALKERMFLFVFKKYSLRPKDFLRYF